tara:strand:+ start:2376 stop:4607 length:2232 start_codon:yes stop_codon:yes gene_type:complete
MRKFLLILSLALLSNFHLNAEIVKRIDISGNKRVSEETVKIYGEIEVNKNYSERDLNEILTNLYSTNFFEDISININNGVLKIKLVEYPVINELIILGEASNKYKEQIKKLIKSKKKRSFIKSNLAEDIEIIKKIYASVGYNFAKVEIKTKKISESTLDVVIEVDRGSVSKISKISFIGEKKVRERRLRDVIASEEDKFWKFISRNTKYSQELVKLDMRLLKNYYKSIGYYDVQVTSQSAELNKTGDIQLIYSIEAGNRYIINKISIDTDPVFDAKLFFPLNKEFEKNIGKYYSPFIIKELLEEIDILIENNNLQFVEHNVQEIIENNNIAIKFNIGEGQKILVERINILGNNVTNESVIRSELLLDEGDPFTQLNLDKSIAKIKSRNIFKTVKYNISDGTAQNLKKIDIVVEEKPTGEISAGAGIGTNGGSFAFIIKENNWLGEGKRVGFDIAVDQDSLKGTVSYSDPNYDFLGNAINYSLSSTTNDKPNQGYENTLLAGSVGTSFEQYKDIFVNLGLSASFDDLKTDDTATASLQKQSGNFTELAGNYGFTYDKRNRAFMPTDGSIVSFQQSIPFYADKSFINNTFSASTYETLSENIVGAGKIYLSAINGLGSDDVRLSKRKFLPGKRLRGFERGKVGPVDGTDHVGGNYAAAVNFEASLPNFFPESTNTEVQLFFDVGNVWGVDYDGTIDDSNKLRSSTGAAASWISPVGPMTFIFSTNISKATTDITESFNFNLGTTF